MKFTVGVISDTHGLLREEAVSALRETDLIIHAGDVGTPEILDRLRSIAPVVAVRGNIDIDPWASALPMTAIAQACEARVFVLHKIGDLAIDPARQGFRAVISGHSHRPASSVREGVLWLNPGSAGPRRFRLPVTVVRLDAVSMTPEFIHLTP